MESAVGVDDVRDSASASVPTKSLSGWAKVKKVMLASKEAQKQETAKDSDLSSVKRIVERATSTVNKEGVGFKRLDDKRLEVALSQLETENYDKFDIGAPWFGLINELLPMADKILGIDDDFIDEDVTLKQSPMSPERKRRGKEKENEKEKEKEERTETDQKGKGKGAVAVAVAGKDSEQKHDNAHAHEVSSAMSKVEFVGSTARLEVLQRLLEKTQGGKERPQQKIRENSDTHSP
jgi:hypothetical protein